MRSGCERPVCLLSKECWPRHGSSDRLPAVLGGVKEIEKSGHNGRDADAGGNGPLQDELAFAAHRRTAHAREKIITLSVFAHCSRVPAIASTGRDDAMRGAARQDRELSPKEAAALPFLIPAMPLKHRGGVSQFPG